MFPAFNFAEGEMSLSGGNVCGGSLGAQLGKGRCHHQMSDRSTVTNENPSPANQILRPFGQPNYPP